MTTITLGNKALASTAKDRKIKQKGKLINRIILKVKLLENSNYNTLLIVRSFILLAGNASALGLQTIHNRLRMQIRTLCM